MTPRQILETVCQDYNVNSKDVMSRSRKRIYTEPRFITQYLMQKHIPEISLSRIGNYTGGRDHSTIINAIKRLRNYMETEKPLRSRIELIEKKLIEA